MSLDPSECMCIGHEFEIHVADDDEPDSTDSNTVFQMKKDYDRVVRRGLDWHKTKRLDDEALQIQKCTSAPTMLFYRVHIETVVYRTTLLAVLKLRRNYSQTMYTPMKMMCKSKKVRQPCYF
jgi:hypothetical protein